MKHWRKLRLLPLLVILLFSMALTATGCSKTAAEEEADNREIINEEKLASVRDYTQSIFVDQLFTISPDELDFYNSSGQYIITPTFGDEFLNRYRYFEEKHGGLASASVLDVSEKEHGYDARVLMNGNDGQMMVLTVEYNESVEPVKTKIEDYADDSKDSVGSRLGKAAGNIVIGLGTVFVILVVLTLIISSFRLLQKKEKPAPADAAPAKDATPAAAEAKPAVEAVPAGDPNELIAVITAAIASLDDAPTDGFKVRSIKRLNTNKWR